MLDTRIHCLTMTRPDDVSGLEAAVAAGTIDPKTIVAIIGQTEGDGHARGFCSQSLQLALARLTGQTREEIRDRIPMLMIGGTAGLMTPHLTIICNVRGSSPVDPAAKRLVVVATQTRPLQTEEIGELAQSQLTAEVLRSLMAQEGIAPGDVACVQLKCPQPTQAALNSIINATGGNKPKLAAVVSSRSRGASALGAALALDEVSDSVLTGDVIGTRSDLHTLKGSASSGTEQTRVVAVVFANVAGAAGEYLAGSGVMQSPLDICGARAAFEMAGLATRDGVVCAQDRSRFVTAFVNAGASSAPTCGGFRHTMNSDLLAAYAGHVSKAVGHAVVAGIAQSPLILASAGAEHQGPPGSNLVCVIAKATHPALVATII